MNTIPYASPWRGPDVNALGDLAEAFFDREIVAHRDRFDSQHHVDREVWRKAGDLGLLCCSIPTEYGGGGGTFAHDLAVIEAQARVLDFGFGNGVHSGIVAHYLLAYGSDEQKHRWLPRLAAGEWIGAIAMTEPDTGSDLQAITTSATREGDSYRVNGAKTFITNGSMADLVIVAAKTDPAAGAKGISLIVVETGECSGFTRGRVLDKIGQPSADTCELFFDDVVVPADNLLGGVEGRGFAQLSTQLAQERLMIAVNAVTTMEVAIAQTVDYTKSRKAFGRTVFDFQNSRFALADCHTTAYIARVFVDDCIERHLRGELDATTAAMAKQRLSEQQCSVVDQCLQLFGGNGYMREYPIARLYADVRIQKIYGGTNEIMKEIIARAV